MMLSFAIRGLAVGALAALILVVLSKFIIIRFDIIRAAISLGVGGLSIGMIWALALPISLFDVAFTCDNHLGLKERITSALEFSARKDPNPLVPALIADADRYACAIRPRRDFPLRLPREVIFALAFVAVSVGLYFVPPWQYVFASEEKKQEMADVKAQAERVREIAQEIKLDLPADRSDLASEVARELSQLAKDMRFGTLTKAEALQRLSAIQEKLDQSQQDSGYNDLKQRIAQMQQAIRNNEDLAQAANSLSQGNAKAAQDALNQLAQKVESGQVKPQDYESLAKSLEQAANSLGDNPQTQELAKNLQQAAQELRSASQGAAQADPKTMASQLIDAINKSLPEIDSMSVPQAVKDQAKKELESIRDDLQKKLDAGQVTQQDIANAQQQIQQVKNMLEKAGANFGNKQTPEEMAQQLKKEAENLLNQSSQIPNIDQKVLSQAQQTLQSAISDLEQRINQGTVSEQSNAVAKAQIDQARQALEQAGMNEENARQLKQAAEDLMRQAAGMNVDPSVRSDALSKLQDVADKLDQQIAQHSTSSQSNADAKQQIEQIRQQLQDARPTDEVARELQQEAQQLQGVCNSRTDIPPAQQTQMQSACQAVSDKLGRELSQGSTSKQSNADARRQLDQIKQQLGGNSQCQNPSQSSSQSGQQGTPSACPSGMQSLFGMCNKPGQNNSGSCSKAGQALRSAGGSCNKPGSSMCSGNSLSRAQSGLGNCRRGLGGQCPNPQNGGQSNNPGGQAASGWGVGTTNSEGGSGPVANKPWTGNSEDPNHASHDMTDYQSIYNSQILQNQSYQTQVGGKDTGEGGSLVMIQKVDPNTGETSYVPYFALAPSDMQSLMNSIEDQDIPRSYEDLVRAYFEQLTGGKKEGQ
jgi:hypothetical protein